MPGIHQGLGPVLMIEPPDTTLRFILHVECTPHLLDSFEINITQTALGIGAEPHWFEVTTGHTFLHWHRNIFRTVGSRQN